MKQPSDADLERRWRELARVLGPLRRVRTLEGKDRTLRFGRGVVRTKDGKKETAIVTCGLSLAGHGVEFYVVPAGAGDVTFAQAFLEKAARETVADGPVDWEALMRDHERAAIEMTGRVRGHDVVALVEAGVGLLPRKLGRSVLLLALTSVTRALAKRRFEGASFFEIDDLSEIYRWLGRVRDPKHADASKPLAQRAPAPAAAPRRRAERATRRM
jgi:hypothetical protein